MAGEGEPAVAQPVPVVGDGEPARFLGECFLPLQGLELVGFGDLGGDHLQDVVGEPAECDRVVDGGAPDQVRLRLGAVLDRERVDTLDDHHGLLFGDVAGGHRVPDRLVVAVQGVRELEAALRVPLGLPGGVGPQAAVSVAPAVAPRSRRSAWWACRSSSSVIWCRSRASAVRLVVGLGRAQGPQSEVGDVVQLLGDGGDRGGDRVLPGVVECRCHTGNSGIDHRQSRAQNRPRFRDVDKSSDCFWSARCCGLDKLDHRRLACLLKHRPT